MPPAAQRLARGREPLHAMIAEFDHKQVSLAVELQIVGVGEPARLGSLLAPHEQQLARSVEHLHAMVAGIGDPDAVLFVDGHVLRPHELAGLGTVAPPLQHELAVGRELLDAVVFAIFGDIVVSVAILNHVGDQSELAGAAPHRAADFRQQLAIGLLAQRIVDQHLVIMGVGDQHAPFIVDRQSGGLAHRVVGRAPAAEEIAVGVEDLNMGLHVDDIQQIVGIDGHGARLLEAAQRDAAAAPNLVEMPPIVSLGGFVATGTQPQSRQRGEPAAKIATVT